jgi:hypothetical protein
MTPDEVKRNRRVRVLPVPDDNQPEQFGMILSDEPRRGMITIELDDVYRNMDEDNGERVIAIDQLELADEERRYGR